MLNRGITGLLTATIVAIVLYFLNLAYVLIFVTIVSFGYFLALDYPYLLAVSREYDIVLRPMDTTYLLISYAFGEGILTALSGYLMDLIHPMSLFVYLLIVGIFRQFIHYRMLRMFE